MGPLLASVRPIASIAAIWRPAAQAGARGTRLGHRPFERGDGPPRADREHDGRGRERDAALHEAVLDGRVGEARSTVRATASIMAPTART